MIEHNPLDEHDKFEGFIALSDVSALTAEEWAELKNHLENCEQCQEAYREHRVLTTAGIPTMADAYSKRGPYRSWDNTATRQKLIARVKAAKEQDSSMVIERIPAVVSEQVSQLAMSRRSAAGPFLFAGLAASLILAFSVGAYHLGSRRTVQAMHVQASVEDRLRALTEQKKDIDQVLDAQAKRISELEDESSHKGQALLKLSADLQAVENRSNQLAAVDNTKDQQLLAASQQHDTLNAKLRDAEQSFQNVEAELAKLRSERDKALLRTASLESQMNDLSAANHDMERRLTDDQQYLASDRDIREMMGARKLYIADVFDVDSRSRTRKPYGRVFLTQGKSLLFYAFDLDQERGLKNASVFEAWGRKETPQGMEEAAPVSLGILYMDSETNRRWVLRCDDPKRLGEIDAVFVTVEPRVGNSKPSTKPFLYALLRKEVNHP